jgi:hypothetical protein
MKFYININSWTWNYLNKIINNKLTAIFSNKSSYVEFFKNGVLHNTKNAAIIYNSKYKDFISNNKRYGCENDFTKHSWRKFIKLQVFL